jgi:hypothetical protein
MLVVVLDTSFRFDANHRNRVGSGEPREAVFSDGWAITPGCICDTGAAPGIVAGQAVRTGG